MRISNSSKINANELFNLIMSKQWADNNDIYLISGKGKNAAVEDKKEIIKSIKDKGYKLPTGVVPMEEVVKFYNINISYLKKICNLQKNERS